MSGAGQRWWRIDSNSRLVLRRGWQQAFARSGHARTRLGRGVGWLRNSGPMARSVRDVALFLDVLAGHVVGDPYGAPDPVTSFRAAVDNPSRQLKIAVLPKSAITRGDSESEAALGSAAKIFEQLGHSVEAVDVDQAQD